VQVRVLLGPAGSGKTAVCLGEIRENLVQAPDGPALVLLAPKQTTYQLERQLLSDPALPGYTRLQILSFERLASFVFDELGVPRPELIDEEGRLMVLRGLLSRKRNDFRLFRASARLTGFAQELSRVLSEFERHQITPEYLLNLASDLSHSVGLAYKLEDLATIMKEYAAWLAARKLQDADRLLSAATQVLASVSQDSPGSSPLHIAQLWVDGFGEWSPQELEFLAGVVAHSGTATITFCLDHPVQKLSWASSWSVIQKAYEACTKRLSAIPGVEITTTTLPRRAQTSRFSRSATLTHLERYWADPRPQPHEDPDVTGDNLPWTGSLRLVRAADPESEAVEAGREILRHVRAGGRYRDVAVLVRAFDGYHEPLRRVFTRYGIPFFLDRRESVSHHPLAELTRGALRTVAFNWQWSDWFGTLKTGLIPAEDKEIDRLENESLARGWQGNIWQKPIEIPQDEGLTVFVRQLQNRILPPFQRLALAVATAGNRPTGSQLVTAVRRFWSDLNVVEQLEHWAAAPRPTAEEDFGLPPLAHATVWEQMNQWVQNVELAFPEEAIPLRQWLPILEAGLANLTVGLIPPALDQVLIGTVDRSRSPDARLAIVLGLNEGIFPAAPKAEVLLTETDRATLEQKGVPLGSSVRQQIGRERYYAYLAFTRARERLVLTLSSRDADGSLLNPSAFISSLRQLFPGLKPESPSAADGTCEHPAELIPALLRSSFADGLVLREARAMQELERPEAAVLAHPAISGLLRELQQLRNPSMTETVVPELIRKLYGPALRTSVSRLEQFAACPFKFFVHSGLRAEERKKFELDVKEQGSFQHDVLAIFHEELRLENLNWRQITPAEARSRVGNIATRLIGTYREGLLNVSEQTRFMARILTSSLQDFVETLVGWMREQYQFDPVQVELAFGLDSAFPPWTIPLSNGNALQLHGRIDRVDLSINRTAEEALCVVIDYKSSQKKLDDLMISCGLQLQLLAYLNVLRRWPDPTAVFAVGKLVPAGVFYVSLRGKYKREPNRVSALTEADAARKMAYQHSGRFDYNALRHLDSRTDATRGDQFNYRLTQLGELHRGCAEALSNERFSALLDQVEATIAGMGADIFSGKVDVSPYRKGSVTACDQCSYRAVCRMDPWVHAFRMLRAPSVEDFDSSAATP
jgi:ATP-dependent helicase/nuclease subunit B